MVSPILGFSGERFDALHVLSLGEHCKRPKTPSPFVAATGQHGAFQVLRRAESTADQAAEIVRHWNGLPEGEQARCHSPGFAIEVFANKMPVFVAAICWQCNNISLGGVMATIDHRTFEARSIPGSRLLTLCQRVMTNV